MPKGVKKSADNGALPYDVPLADLEEAARKITGWCLASMDTKPNQENALVTEMRFSHRGAFIFPERALKVEGVSRVHHFVQFGEAHVWVTWKPAAALAGSR